MNVPGQPLVYVLLSTFNGERFLPELVASLQSQSYRNFRVLVRDDGSLDKTPELLKRLGAEDDRFEVILGENLGPADSFLDLVYRLPSDARFFGFCDQDDVWDPDKVETAVNHLESYEDAPAMYFCRLRITDRELRGSRLSPVPGRPLRFANALAQNVAQGCTVFANRPAMERLQLYRPPSGRVRMHDWWLYQLVSATGSVIYDPEPHITHRQHSDNTVGHPGLFRKWGRRLVRFRRKRGQLLRQARLVLEVLGAELKPGDRALVETLLTQAGSKHFLTRLRFVVGMPIYRQHPLENLILRFLILFNLH